MAYRPAFVKFFVLLVSMAVILAAALFPSTAGAHPALAPPNTLTAAFDADFTGLDPAIGYDPFSWTGEHAIFSSLLDYAATTGRAGTRLVPGVAIALPGVTNGGRIYTSSSARCTLCASRPPRGNRIRLQVFHRASAGEEHRRSDVPEPVF